MTDKDIKKALECCAKDYCHTSECPIFIGTTSEDCRNELIKSALDLINRLQERKEYYKNNRNEYQDKVMFISKQCDELQEENSRQKAEKEALIAGQETLQKYIAEQKAEIERLQKAIKVQEIMLGNQDSMIKKARAEVAREIFAEIYDIGDISIDKYDSLYLTLSFGKYIELKNKYTKE